MAKARPNKYSRRKLAVAPTRRTVQLSARRISRPLEQMWSAEDTLKQLKKPRRRRLNLSLVKARRTQGTGHLELVRHSRYRARAVRSALTTKLKLEKRHGWLKKLQASMNRLANGLRKMEERRKGR